jgi:hypothetical protein
MIVMTVVIAIMTTDSIIGRSDALATARSSSATMN